MMNSAMKARKMLHKKCTCFLAHLVSRVEPSLSIDKMSIVMKFVDVFPKELPKPAPKQKVEFNIELVSGITLISKTSYRMTLVEL